MADIRRTVDTLYTKYTGEQIRTALQKVAEQVNGVYKEKLLHDIDGYQTLELRIAQACPGQHIVVYTGPDFQTREVCPEIAYTAIGVGNIKNKKGRKHSEKKPSVDEVRKLVVEVKQKLESELYSMADRDPDGPIELDIVLPLSS